MSGLEVRGLKVSVNGKLVLRGVDLEVPPGVIVGLIGPNGSGKTSLAYSIMGHPLYRVEEGEITLDGEVINHLKTEERASRGLFLVFQSPPEIGGLPVSVFLREVLARRGVEVGEEALSMYMREVGLGEEYLSRYVHEGFSGGEKRRFEFLQALLFKPRILIVDELDSGLDLEGVKSLTGKVRELAESGAGVLYISHNPLALRTLRPHRIVVLVDGKVRAAGGLELLDEVEEKGYQVVLGE